MNHTAPAPAAARRVSLLLLGALVLVLAGIVGTLVYPTGSSSATSFGDVLRGEDRGALSADDGLITGRASVFDDELPAVVNLDPSLLEALRRAATDAAEDGVEFRVNSGWRSPDYQAQLLREAVSTYGSEEEAARWVATPQASAHVTGDAVDVGDLDATVWLSDRGADYGLCRTYTNEPWHFELRPDAVAHGCPREYADPTHDPRMR